MSEYKCIMTITKKNGKYYCRFQLNGERHHYLCKGAETLTQAKQQEAMYMVEIDKLQHGIGKKENRVLLSKLYQAFMQYSETNKKSWKHDKSRLEVVKKFWSGKKYVKEIIPEDIEKLKVFLLTEGKSKATVNRYIEIVSKMFNIALDNGWSDKNPCRKAKFKTKNYQLRVLGEGNEQERLFQATSDDFYGIILTALNSGLRKSNIQNLKGKNIRLDYRIFEITENKGNKHIKLPINDVLYDYFSKLNFSSEDYIFTHNGKKWSNTAFHTEWHKILNKAGITGLRFHDLRHTVGTRLAKAGIPIPVIKDIFAHSNIQTTMQYVHTASEQMTSAMAVLNSYN